MNNKKLSKVDFCLNFKNKIKDKNNHTQLFRNIHNHLLIFKTCSNYFDNNHNY